MSTFEIIWYDLEGEKARDIITADSTEDAIVKGYKKYNGNPPASQYSVITNPKREDGWNV